MGDSGASFDAQKFSALARSGLPLTVTALRSDLRAVPSPSNPHPFVCVYGLRAGNTIFYAPADRIAWERTNRFYGLCSAYVFSALTFGLLLTSIYFQIRVVEEPIQPRIEWTPEKKLQTGVIQIFASSTGIAFSWLLYYYVFHKPQFFVSCGYLFALFFFGIFRCISGWRELRRRRTSEI